MTVAKTGVSYADAGVDIDAGNNLVDRIKPLTKATSRIGADTNIGGFGGLFDLAATGYQDPVLVAATDGVGTKLKIAQLAQKHDSIGIDLVAMCVNDLVVQGAEPLFFLDYFATGKLSVDEAHDVVKGISEGCIQAGAALIGGETAEMPGMYKPGDYDLAGFSVGAVERDAILPLKNMQEGDVVIGLASNGIHSNGYSLVRHVIDNSDADYQDVFENGKTLAETLLEPTRIYVKSCLAAIKDNGVKALAHITGGGITENIPRVLPDDLAVSIDASSWTPSSIFSFVKAKGNIETSEMLRTFNCGIGMALVVSEAGADAAIATLNANGEKASVIGNVTKRSTEAVEYTDLDKLFG